MMDPEAEHEPAPQVGDEAVTTHAEIEPEKVEVEVDAEDSEKATEKEEEKEGEDQEVVLHVENEEDEVAVYKSDKPVLTTNTETLQVPIAGGGYEGEGEETPEGSLHDVSLDTPQLTRNKPLPKTITPSPLSNGHVAPIEPIPIPTTPSTAGTSKRTTQPRTNATSITLAQGQVVSVVLISSALETIAASKEAKRSTPLRESVKHALEMLRAGEGGDKPREIFEPLRLACETRNDKLMIASLDCISKLISYSFFLEETPAAQPYASPPPSPTGSSSGIPVSLVDLVTHTITSAYSESTPDAVSLQIVKALLALVLSSTLLVHHSSLLKAVRTVYNVFLLSNDPVNQMVAQGGLTQMVHHVFARCKIGPELDGDKEPTPIGSTTPEDAATIPLPPPTPEEEHLSTPTHGREVTTSSTQSDAGDEHALSNLPPHEITINDLFIKDAFLVFRALCKLTMKPLATESERDLKSHAMRSKLLSLHLVLTVLSSHMPVFVSPSSIIHSTSHHESADGIPTNKDGTPFIQAAKQYLWPSLSRNAVSAVPQVFEISVEIFWRVLDGMRGKLKKEIELLFNEIFIPILEMRNSTLKQKATLLNMLNKLCQDPQALVEIYLNYDCDSDAPENIYEKLMNIISKIGTNTHITPRKGAEEPNSPALRATQGGARNSPSIPPSLSTTAMGPDGTGSTGILSEASLKRQSLECLVAVLRSLVAWGTAAGVNVGGGSVSNHSAAAGSANGTGPTTSMNGHESRTSVSDLDTPGEAPPPQWLNVNGNGSSVDFGTRTPTTATEFGVGASDDPTRFESAKQKKTTLLEGVRKFNFSGKRGVKFFIETGFIPSASPQDIAAFLLITDGLSKAQIGEYLGEGDAHNVATMHAFVDLLDFSGLTFIQALRMFLQAFRLPGEAQKIERYMLKFAERYFLTNTGTPFANADTPYILAYSTILLNTDAYNPQVKKRMTKTDFIKNNGGINDGGNLPEDFLNSIYDDILGEEIRMKDEIIDPGLAFSQGSSGLAGALANVGRDLQKEAYVVQSNGMAVKTEALFRTLMRTQRRSTRNYQFFSASQFAHVRPMFENAWMPFLAGLSGPLQDTDDLEVVELCLEGFRNAIRIVCYFDLELQRNAFVTTLGKFTFLNNLGEMKAKNMEAIKALLDVAVTQGNNLKGSWHEVLTCVSQLERMQFINAGADPGRGTRQKARPAEELANESRSTHITVAADMVFSLSHFLSGTAIVDFVQALSDVSWEEIQSSGMSDNPRLFSLQKLVDISYYNMNRIRLEWTNLWAILGEHFNQVCTHSNPHVGFFALDALRQLAVRFLEKEEMANFKFQQNFLKPFEYTMIHNPNPDVRDMVLQCLHQIVQTRDRNMRSGWRTLFAVFSAASRALTERVAGSAYEIVTALNRDHFSAIVHNGSFADMTVCMTDFCKVSKYQKISLSAIAMLRAVIPKMLASPDCFPTAHSQPPTEVAPGQTASGTTLDDPMMKYWFPVLFAFFDIIMNGEDLEVRRLALDSMFSTLKTYGDSFPVEFWDTVLKQLLFPIFAVLKSSQDLSRFTTQEDMSVWLSTTMIQALRSLIDLYTYFFDVLERILDPLLDLLCVCICQENDTLARIGTSCLQQLLEQNVQKLSGQRWDRITTTFIRLFQTTTPHQLFDEELRVEIDNTGEMPETPAPQGPSMMPAPLSPGGDPADLPTVPTTPRAMIVNRKRVFQQIIVKCVLQLLLIETTHELLQNREVYNTIPAEHLLRLMAVLDHSYQFAHTFNADKELRTGLWKVGFMKHLPNLLKQESSSAATLVNVLLRMYYDPRPDMQAIKPQVADRLMPLGLGVIEDFNGLKAETQGKNILAWTPIVAEVLQGFHRLDDQAFLRYLPAFYPLSTDMLARDISADIRLALRDIFVRIGKLQGIVHEL